MIDRDNFYVVLPSNSSMSYFPENTTTHFITQLPTALQFSGTWGVSLSEIQIPMTFLHIPKANEKNFVSIFTHRRFDNTNSVTENADIAEESSESIPYGVYSSVHDVVQAINQLSIMRNHLHIKINSGGFTIVTRMCDIQCKELDHLFHMSPILRKILGISVSKYHSLSSNGSSYTGTCPAALTNALPSTMFVYTDICESYITGDIQTPLLRVVPLEIEKYSYGSMKIKCFPATRYIPLLHRNFQTIEIDIRDEFGEAIPFECGTLTVTLQFKRIA